MTYGITRDSLGKIQLLSTGWRLQRGAQSWKIFLLLREMLSNGQKNWLECMIVINLISTVLNTIFKISCVFVLICWKIEYKQSLMENDLKRIQQHSSHSIACPTLYFVQGRHSGFYIWTWNSPRFHGISYSIYWWVQTGNWLSLTTTDLECQIFIAKLKSCHVTSSGLW